MEQQAASTPGDRRGDGLGDVDAPSTRLESGLDGLDGSSGLDGLTGLVGLVHGLSHSLPRTLSKGLSVVALPHARVLILRKCGCSWPLPHTDDRIAALTHIPFVLDADSPVLVNSTTTLVGWVGRVGWVGWVRWVDWVR